MTDGGLGTAESKPMTSHDAHFKENNGVASRLRANGVRISYEAGYTGLGGRTIYIQFQSGFTSGTREQALVTLTEDGKVEVSESEVKDSQQIE
jgi:hypothetical protein